MMRAVQREVSSMRQLSGEEVAGEVEMRRRNGEAAMLARWRVLKHLVLHGMQHHAEVAERLTAKGQSPGDLDFIFYG